MEAQPETKTVNEEKHSFSRTGFIVWPLVVLVLYFLSFGPALMMMNKGLISRNNKFFHMFYEPLAWAAQNTPLRGPILTYLDWCVPDRDQ